MKKRKSVDSNVMFFFQKSDDANTKINLYYYFYYYYYNNNYYYYYYYYLLTLSLSLSPLLSSVCFRMVKDCSRNFRKKVTLTLSFSSFQYSEKEVQTQMKVVLLLLLFNELTTSEWTCRFRYEQSSKCKNPRMSVETPYYNLGYPLIKRFCKDVECYGFNPLDIPTKVTKSLFYNVSFVWVPDYNTKFISLDNDVPSSGFKAQFHMNVVLSELGMDTYIALDMPTWFMKDLHPKIRTIKSLHESFAIKHAGRLVVSTPENNANRLHRIMNRSGVLGKKTEDVRYVMWVMGLERTVRQIKDEKMRTVGNVHHSHKQFYSPGATPATARLPDEQIRDTESMKLSDIIGKKRNLVLVDRDAYHLDINAIVEKVTAQIPDVQFHVLSGMTIDQVREAYSQAKLTIDSFMKGGEAINFEGAMFFCLPMVTDQMVGHDDYDLQLPPSLKIDPFDVNDAANKIVHALNHYEEMVSEVSQHRKFSSRLKEYFRRDIAMYFSGSSTLFVTSATSFDSYRAVVPWALSVWSHFPTARIEIYVSNVMLFEKELEAILLTMEFHNMWLPSFVRIRAIPTSYLNLGEMSRFVITPLTTGHQYTVISKSRTILLGRDLLNAHVQFMDEYDLVSSLYDRDCLLKSPAVVVYIFSLSVSFCLSLCLSLCIISKSQTCIYIYITRYEVKNTGVNSSLVIQIH